MDCGLVTVTFEWYFLSPDIYLLLSSWAHSFLCSCSPTVRGLLCWLDWADPSLLLSWADPWLLLLQHGVMSGMQIVLITQCNDRNSSFSPSIIHNTHVHQSSLGRRSLGRQQSQSMIRLHTILPVRIIQFSGPKNNWDVHLKSILPIYASRYCYYRVQGLLLIWLDSCLWWVSSHFLSQDPSLRRKLRLRYGNIFLNQENILSPESIYIP